MFTGAIALFESVIDILSPLDLHFLGWFVKGSEVLLPGTECVFSGQVI